MATDRVVGTVLRAAGRRGLEVVLHRRLIVDDRNRAVPAGAERVLRSGVRVAAHAADVLGVATAGTSSVPRDRRTLADLVQRPGVAGIDDAHGAVGRHARVPGCRQDAAGGGARGGHASASRHAGAGRAAGPRPAEPAAPRPPVPVVPLPPVPVPPVPVPPAPVVLMPPVPVVPPAARPGATRARRISATRAAAASPRGPAGAGRRAAAARSGPSGREGRAGQGRCAKQQRKRKNKATLLHFDLLH